jgi:hypothetical protein
VTPSRPHWTGLKGFGSGGTLRDRPDVVDQPVATTSSTSERKNAQGIVDADIHVWKPAPQSLGEVGIDLDGHDTRAGAHERRRQDTGPSTEIENEVTGPNARSANELRDQLATAEKVLAAPARSRSNGHGKPPRP